MVVTNGILLSTDRILELKETCNLEKVQITLDGMPEMYSKIKGALLACFNAVINNIKLLAKNAITVHIKMNYMDKSFGYLAELINYLKSKISLNP